MSDDDKAIRAAKLTLGGMLDKKRAKEARERAGGQIAPSKYLSDVPRQAHAYGGRANERDDIWWHGSPSGDLRGGTSGLHLGTREAALDALRARIGVPADGSMWDGTKEYGKTLLAGKKTLNRMGKYLISGHNARAPEEDYYPHEHPEGMPTVGNKVPVDPSWKPFLRPFRIVGPMTNTPWSPHGDGRANAMMKASLTKGNAKNGYYYTNDGEDSGSISAVVPNGSHVEPVDQDNKYASGGYVPAATLPVPRRLAVAAPLQPASAQPSALDALAGLAGTASKIGDTATGLFGRQEEQHHPNDGHDHGPATAPSADNGGMSEAALAAWSGLTDAWGQPLTVTSAYRDPKRNEEVGGAKGSQHMHGNAYDVDTSHLSHDERLALADAAWNAGFRGIGFYDNSMHFDVADPRAWGPSHSRDSIPEWALPWATQRYGYADGGEVTDLGQVREQKQLQGFHKGMMDDLGTRMTNAMDAHQKAVDAGVFDGYEVGDVLKGSAHPMRITGRFMRKWKPTPMTLGSFERMGAKPTIVEHEGEQYIPMLRYETGVEGEDGWQRGDAYLDGVKAAGYQKMGGLRAVKADGGSVGGDDIPNWSGNPDFQKWFGASKAVDETGSPLVLYHGTNQNIDQFDPKRGGTATGENAGATKGFFFTDNKDVAQQYADRAGRAVIPNVVEHERETQRLQREVARLEAVAHRTGSWDAYERAVEAWEDHEAKARNASDDEGKNIVHAHLSLQNPKIVDFGGGRLSMDRDLDSMIEEAKAAGHDGMILKNLEDSPQMGIVSNHYVAFAPHQIKSVHNSGRFDPKDPRIHRADGGSVDDLPLVGKNRNGVPEDDAVASPLRKAEYPYMSMTPARQAHADALRQAINKAHAEAKEVDLPIDQIVTDVSAIGRSRVKNPAGGLPFVERINGVHHLRDGNHRVAAAMLRGDKTVRALVADMDEAIRANGRADGGSVVDRSPMFEGMHEDLRDETGKPLDLWHGTPHQFDAFDDRKVGENTDMGFYGRGHYLTPDQDLAGEYAGPEDEGHIMGPLHAALKNPFVWDMSNEDRAYRTKKDLETMGIRREGKLDPWDNLRSHEIDTFMQHMQKRGHDGVIVKQPNWQDGEGANVTEIVVFNPNMIKHRDAEVGDPNDPRIMRATGGKVDLYSKAARIIRGMKDQPMPVDDIVKYALGKGVKKAEIDHSDIPSGKARPSQVAEHIEFMQPQIGVNRRGDAINEYRRMMDGDMMSYTRDDFRRMDQLEREAFMSENRPQYAQYQLPGGENYREHVLTLDNHPDDQTYMARAHWGDMENPLAHIRMSDRKTPDGRKLLHIEEMQSDWNNAARYQGFRTGREKQDYDDFVEDMRNQMIARVNARTGQDYYDPMTGEVAPTMSPMVAKAQIEKYKQMDPYTLALKLGVQDRHNQMARAANEKTMAPPRAPYINPKRDDWAELAMKHVLTEAAKGGYDGVTFTPDAAQSQRWGGTNFDGIYDKKLPGLAHRLVQQHDPSVQPDQVGLPNTTTPSAVIPLTDTARSSIMKNSFPAFRRGGYVTHVRRAR